MTYCRLMVRCLEEEAMPEFVGVEGTGELGNGMSAEEREATVFLVVLEEAGTYREARRRRASFSGGCE
jgi:hypothetical protein